MEFPKFDVSSTDKELIEEFYRELLIRYPQLKEDVEYNNGLLHCDMGDFRRLAEQLCEERKFEEARECFDWVNSLFCRSKNELLNAFNVSFLEYFDYQKGLTESEFKNLMPKELFRGYTEMMEYMERLSGTANQKDKSRNS